jgi:hypothetical protein
MRWIGLVVLALACTDGTAPTDNVLPTDNPGPDLAWLNMRADTSSTFNAVYVGGTGAFVVGDDGSAWDVTPGLTRTMLTGVTVRLTGIWGTGAGPTAEVLAVGYAGRILRRAGNTFVEEVHPNVGTTNFEDVDGVTSADLTAVSATGIYRFRDGNWSFESGAFNRSMRSVYVASNGDAWAVGDGGTVLRRQSDSWYQVASPVGRDLRGVHGRGDTVMVVGHAGTVMTWDGRQFVELDLRTNKNLQAVWVSPSGTAYVVGNNGAAYMIDPPEFDEDGEEIDAGGAAELPTGASSNLYAVAGTDNGNVWTVGNRGAVYRIRQDYQPKYF